MAIDRNLRDKELHPINAYQYVGMIASATWPSDAPVQ